MTYTIGEMAQKLGISTSTLRYYDNEGILPFIEHKKGENRVFTDKDYRWLHIIECLKKTGMSLKDIKKFVNMTMNGDETISDRLRLFIGQKERVENKIAQLQETLDLINFKCWYYEEAEKLGTTDGFEKMSLEDYPAEHHDVLVKIMGKDS